MPVEHPAAFVWKDSVQLRSPIIWIKTVTTVGGAWSVDYSEAGFSAVPIVTATPQLKDTDVFDRAYGSVSDVSTTAAAGYCTRAANLLVLGPTVRTVPDGTVVHIVAIGETFVG